MTFMDPKLAFALTPRFKVTSKHCCLNRILSDASETPDFLPAASLLFWRSHIYQHCDFLFGLLQLVYLHCSIRPIWHSSANAALAPHPRLQTFYPFSARFVSSPSAPSPRRMLLLVSLYLLLLFPSLTPSGFFNRMLGISEPGALNCYNLFCLIPLTLFVSRNLTLIHLPLSGSLDSLLCDLIAATPVLIFFLLMSKTLSAASLFLSDRANPFLSFLPPLFLCLTPSLIM